MIHQHQDCKGLQTRRWLLMVSHHINLHELRQIQLKLVDRFKVNIKYDRQIHQINIGNKKHPETSSSSLREYLNYYTHDWEFITMENNNREITQPLSTPIFGRASKLCFFIICSLSDESLINIACFAIIPYKKKIKSNHA